MFGSKLGGASVYAKVGMETDVISASPHRLIAMLFDGALAAIKTAVHQMEQKNITAKSAAVNKAAHIVNTGLRAVLDKNVGGDMAMQLDALYEFICKRMMIANLENDPAIFQEVTNLLIELRDAWAAIEPQSYNTMPMQRAEADSAIYTPASGRSVATAA